jgi:hypothetical protein
MPCVLAKSERRGVKYCKKMNDELAKIKRGKDKYRYK